MLSPGEQIVGAAAEPQQFLRVPGDPPGRPQVRWAELDGRSLNQLRSRFRTT
jgi:hypothetical protein